MNRVISTSTGVLGNEIRLRMGQASFEQLRHHLAADPSNEQFAFLLAKREMTACGTVLIVREVYLPESSDLDHQSMGGVAPSKAFQRAVYQAAAESGCDIVDVHTHPHTGTPRFSAIDERIGHSNAKDIQRVFGGAITLAMIVFGSDIIGHDGVIFDPELDDFREIQAIELLGRSIDIRVTGASVHSETDQKHDRQRLIPGMDQSRLERLRIAIVGCGGNGSQLASLALSMGCGRAGWIACIDHDTIESSNLARIPYAGFDDIGIRKVDCFARHAAKADPATRVVPIVATADSAVARGHMAAASVILGCGDNDGLRKLANEIAVRYGVPYIDLGCGVIVTEDSIEAGGQVQVVLPGANQCLLCRGGYDVSQASLSLMHEDARGAYRSAGYVTGADADPTPSIAVLNADVARIAATALIGMTSDNGFPVHDATYSDVMRGTLLNAESRYEPDCPLCGALGYLNAGSATEPPLTEAPRPDQDGQIASESSLDLNPEHDVGGHSDRVLSIDHEAKSPLRLSESEVEASDAVDA